MLLCLPLGQLLFINKKKSAGGVKLFLGRENSRATPPLYEALITAVCYQALRREECKKESTRSVYFMEE